MEEKITKIMALITEAYGIYNTLSPEDQDIAEAKMVEIKE